MTDEILSFQGEYRFLSNFFVESDGTTVEHEFQASKTLDPEWRDRILCCPTPGRAKRMGRLAPLRPDWETTKIAVMAGLVTKKFIEHPELARLLLETGDARLVEGNTWGDKFWGVCDGEGQNWLGRILIQVRDTLRVNQHLLEVQPTR